MKKPRKSDCPSEQEEQEAIFAWARNPLVLRGQPDLAMLISTQSGMRVSIGTAVKAKRAGMPKGFPDLALLCARSMEDEHCRSWGHYCGLFIELKKIKGGVVSPEQKDWLAFLREQGYGAIVCYGWLEARKVLIDYLERTK